MSDDEFGDASFLMEVDLDAIEAKAAASAPPARSSSKENENPSNKRQKVTPATDAELEQTLSKYFGHAKFRPGQLSVIQSVVSENKDAAVFWATGSGKSVCYQIPALHSNKVTLVISPLISLMKDQVHKLNGLMLGRDFATFLGSGQSDLNQERAALEGKYLLVYLTPEKLLSSGFLQQLTTMHTTKREIGLIAIDEAHCVSEWGHDFRPEFRKIGRALRTQAPAPIQQIPIVALTATAVPKVQEDICKSLHLNKPHVDKQSFDRTNLVIAVHKKDRSAAIPSAMEPLLNTLQETSSGHQGSRQSTIIYAPTRSQVEDITGFLKQRLDGENGKSKVRVECYHAGMSLEARNQAHLHFLTGKTTVICATVAFGLGIDKPDTRRVIHFGPPKTVEEYYQQIGRAGRDGLKAHCIMYVSETDFDKYKSDFYLGGLQGPAKEAVLASIGALKSFALDSSACRRKALLDFFKETAPFDRCGTCDACTRIQTLDQDDIERDFGPIARVVLQAADALNGQGMGTIVDVISGKTVDSYRYKRSISESQVKEYVSSRKNEVKKRVTQAGYRELIVPLVQRGYMEEATKTSNVSGFSRSWTTYSVTPKGHKALFNRSLPILLPVPESYLEEERKEKARRERVLSQLKESGVQLEKLPQEELEAGEGIVINALSKWHGYLQAMRKNGKEERVAQLEELLAAVEKWRAETAIEQLMAPASVLPEQILLTITYTTATLPSGLAVKEADLIAAGVRTRGIGSLCDVLVQWADKYRPAEAKKTGSDEKGKMRLTPGEVAKGRRPWKHAVYKPAKKSGLATWESSYNRFAEGESAQTIAVAPANGKPIQVGTVSGHIMQALVQGRGVDLHRLAEYSAPPTSSEWEQLQAAEMSQGLDVVEEKTITMTDFLRPITGDKPREERDEEEQKRFGYWCERLKWYMNLRRIGYQPTFEEE